MVLPLPRYGGKESRISPRVILELPVTLRRFNPSKGIVAQIMDISRGGLGLSLPDRWEREGLTTGDFVAFETSEIFFGLKGVGQVAWLDPAEPRAGISFMDLDGAEAKLLEQFLLLCV